MRLRFRTTESVLLAAGLIGLLEQEMVRVVFRLDPSVLISGIAFALVLIGAGVTVGRNFKIGPVEATAEKEHTVSLPPILGWVLVAGGVCVLVLGLSRKN